MARQVRPKADNGTIITVFDFLTFFLGLAMTLLGGFFALAGGANSNFGLAVFSVLLCITGVAISTIRELTSENSDDERDIRRIYGFVCFISGFAYVVISVVRASILLINQNLDLGSSLLLCFMVIIGVVYIFLGYSWAGAFDPPMDE
jgi:hypothetical protein